MDGMERILEGLGIPRVERPEKFFSAPVRLYGWELGNRICALPMEGWDANSDGSPSETTFMRWRRYGASGASLVWGEAAAVSMSARSHFKQLVLVGKNSKAIARLVEETRRKRENAFGKDSMESFKVGIQLLHGGRFAREKPRPVFHDDYLDEATGIDPSSPVLSDGEIEEIIRDFIEAGKLARKAGFDFIDIKLCHGYLGHEILGAKKRRGKYGGPLENRARFILEIARAVKSSTRNLGIASRISFFEPGITFSHFGASEQNPFEQDMDEPIRLLNILSREGIELIGSTLGCPYTTPWLVRPAKFKALGEKDPPESPWKGIERHIRTCMALKKKLPHIKVVLAGLSGLGRHILAAGGAILGSHHADFIGLGRALLANPGLPRLLVQGAPIDEKKVCRTCGLCTTMARKGRPSGCYLHDPFYKNQGK